MVFNRLPISGKFFAVIMLTSGLIVALMALLSIYSLRSGFSNYLAQTEIGRFDNMVRALENSYDRTDRGWPNLAGNRKNWRDFSRQNLPRRNGPEGRRPPPQPLERPDNFSPPNSVQGSDLRDLRPRERGPRDPMLLGSRLVLLSLDENIIVGTGSARSIAAKRAIKVKNKVGEHITVGWLALVNPKHRPDNADALFLNQQRNALFLIAAIALVFSAIAAALLARLLVAPIQKIAAGAKKLAKGKYDTRISIDNNDEIGALATDFNQLADALERAESAEKEWISNAAHELQTPIAILRGGVEAIQDGVRKPTVKNLAELHASIMRLSRLAADINLLSSWRENKMATQRIKENIKEIIEEAADNIRPAINSQKLSLSVECEGELALPCDRFRISQLVTNLLENSRRYTNSPGKIEISASKTDNNIEIRICDSAPSVPKHALPNLFDRFFRVEVSRSQKYGGSGLGLSICKAIVDAHTGTIRAQNCKKLGGLEIIVTFPTMTKVISR